MALAVILQGKGQNRRDIVFLEIKEIPRNRPCLQTLGASSFSFSLTGSGRWGSALGVKEAETPRLPCWAVARFGSKHSRV